MKMTNVKEGFAFAGVRFVKDVSRCLSVMIECRGVPMRALVDTGCAVNVVYKNVYEKLPGDREPYNRLGYVRGIGELQVPVIAKSREEIKVDGISMNVGDFYVIDSENDRYDVLLGYKFLKENQIVVYPREDMIEMKGGGNPKVRWYLNEDGSVRVKMISGVGIYAAENVTVPREKDALVSVKVNWLPYVGLSGTEKYVFMLDGDKAQYKVKRMVQVCDGILDMRDPRVICRVDTDVNKKRWRRIRIGNRLGHLYTVVDMDDKRFVNGVNVMVGELKEDEWTYEGLLEKANIGQQLSEQDRKRVFDMLWERKRAISKGDNDFGGAKLPEFKIRLKDDTPIYQRPRHFPPPVMSEIEKQCEELEQMGVIESSESEWNSPIVPVRKPDGSLRMCIDYRKVNDVTVKDRFPMRVVSECVYGVNGMKVFSKLDLVRGYYQMPVAEESRHITAFCTSQKHYQFRNLSFGLANAPAAFQRAMNVVLREFPKEKVIVFIDDILISSETIEEHISLVSAVLKKLEEVGVKVKLAKCEWFQEEVEFLGHVVSSSGMRKSEKFVSKVRDFPRPKTVRELRGFLGLVEFGRKFIKDCSGISKPLTEWTGKRKSTVLKWDSKMTEAFERLKEEAVKDVELAYPDYGPDAKMLEVYTDASGYSMGGCLMQKQMVDGAEQERVIAYVSKAFNKAERKYSTIERELAALRFCLKVLRVFLFGVRFCVKTDHQPLVYLHRMKSVDSRLARTVEDLSEYDFVVEYVPGGKNVLADMMSRIPVSGKDSVEESINPEYLPRGLVVLKESKGGGDSMFESVLNGLRDLVNDGLKVEVPETVNDLRKRVMTEVCKQPERIGVRKIKTYLKELKAMSEPGVLPMQEVLLVVSLLYGIVVCVHYGVERPVMYKAKSVKGEWVLHLQCLGGVHYNWVVEKKLYEGVDESDECQSEMDDIRDDECEELGESEIKRVSLCVHRERCGATVEMDLSGNKYCGLVDTGAQVSLVSASVIRELEKSTWDVERRCETMALHGLGKGHVMSWEEVVLVVSVGKMEEVKHVFVVVGDDQMPFCFLIGVDFLRMNDIAVDVGSEVLQKDGRVISRMQREQGCMVRFVGVMNVLVNETDLLTQEDIEEMQAVCPMIQRLSECVRLRIPVGDWDVMLRDFRKFSSRFVWCQGLLYFVRKWMGESMYVPVFSVFGTIGICKIVHDRYGHMGKFKLIECMKERVFNPYISRICTDVATMCEACQKSKYQSVC